MTIFNISLPQVGWPEAILILVAFVPGIVGGAVARGKGRNYLLWFLLCFILPPLIFLILWLGPRNQVEGRFRKCPRCRGYSRWSATQCWHCGFFLFDTDSPTDHSRPIGGV